MTVKIIDSSPTAEEVEMMKLTIAIIDRKIDQFVGVALNTVDRIVDSAYEELDPEGTSPEFAKELAKSTLYQIAVDRLQVKLGMAEDEEPEDVARRMQKMKSKPN